MGQFLVSAGQGVEPEQFITGTNKLLSPAIKASQSSAGWASPYAGHPASRQAHEAQDLEFPIDDGQGLGATGLQAHAQGAAQKGEGPMAGRRVIASATWPISSP